MSRLRDGKKSRSNTVAMADGGVYKGELNERMEPVGGVGVLKTRHALLVGEFTPRLELVYGLRYDYGSQVTEEGSWRLGKLHGRGVRVSRLERYEGDWRFGKKDGYGVWFSPNGDRIEGKFRYDSPSGNLCNERRSSHQLIEVLFFRLGSVTIKYSNGDMFQGKMRSCGREHGLFLSADGKKLYSGCWMEDSPIALYNPLKGVTWFTMYLFAFSANSFARDCRRGAFPTFLITAYLLLCFMLVGLCYWLARATSVYQYSSSSVLKKKTKTQ